MAIKVAGYLASTDIMSDNKCHLNSSLSLDLFTLPKFRLSHLTKITFGIQIVHSVDSLQQRSMKNFVNYVVISFLKFVLFSKT